MYTANADPHKHTLTEIQAPSAAIGASEIGAGPECLAAVPGTTFPRRLCHKLVCLAQGQLWDGTPTPSGKWSPRQRDAKATGSCSSRPMRAGALSGGGRRVAPLWQSVGFCGRPVRLVAHLCHRRPVCPSTADPVCRPRSAPAGSGRLSLSPAVLPARSVPGGVCRAARGAGDGA